MSIARRIAFGVGAGWMGRFTAIGIQIVALPVLFRYLPKDELGLWFLLGQSYAIAGLLDLGFTTALTRQVAFVRGSSGSDLDAPISAPCRLQLQRLIATAVSGYRCLAVGVFFVLWIIGSLFITTIDLGNVSTGSAVFVWALFCLSHAGSVWSMLWQAVLRGLGHVGFDAVVNSCIAVITAVLQITAVVMGFGIEALAVLAVVGSLTGRVATWRVARSLQPELLSRQGDLDWSVVKPMRILALKAWGTSLGAFLILKTDQYFIAAFKGSSAIPEYYASFQLVSNVSIVAISFALASNSYVSLLWKAGEIHRLQKLVFVTMRLGLLVMACGSAFILTSGENLLDLWLGPGNTVGLPVLIVLCVTYFLETQHVVVSSASRATGDEAFAWWALASGGLNLAFTWILIQPLGLLGVALGTMLAQLLTNNWYAVRRGFRRLRMGFSDHVREALLPSVAAFVTCLAIGVASNLWIEPRSRLVGLILTAVGCGIVLLFGFATYRDAKRQLLNHFSWNTQ